MFHILNLFLLQVEKKFNIHGSEGEVLYSAKEKSNCCCRFCCGNIRTLDISIRDSTNKDVINLSRPLNCAGLCCGIVYPFCTQALNVSINGESTGKKIIFFRSILFFRKTCKVFKLC